MHEIADRVIDATGILGNSLLGWRDRIACATYLTEKFALFEHYLLGSMVEPRHSTPLLAQFVKRMTNRNNSGSLTDLVLIATTSKTA